MAGYRISYTRDGKKATIEVEKDFSQFYHNMLERFDELKGLCAVKLLFFLSKNMGKNGYIHWSPMMRRGFNSELKKPYNDRAIVNAMAELVDAELILKFGPGNYYVNPMYVWSSDLDARIQFIKTIQSYSPKVLDEAYEEYKKENNG